MADPKDITNKKQQIVTRRMQVSELYLQGMTQAAIAQKVGVSQAVISKDLKELRVQWIERSMEAISERKAIELAKIDALELTYWDAWERSKADRETVTQEKIGEIKDPTTGALIGTRARETRVRTGQTGTSAFLDGVMKCIDKRCKILGLDAPNRNLNIDLTAMTDEQLEQLASGADIITVLAVSEGSNE